MKRTHALILSLAVAGCRGKAGPPGPQGPMGPHGPISPAVPAPQILSVTPPIVSPASRVRIRLAVLPTSLAEVFFDGAPAASVVADPAGDLWATGIPDSGAPFVDVTVGVGNAISNSVSVAMGASGDSRPLAQGGLQRAGGLALAPDGTSIDVFDPDGGIFRFGASSAGAGVLQRLPLSAPIRPVAGVADGADLLVVDSSATGRIVRVTTAGTVVAEVTGLGSTPTSLARASDGTIYWATGTTIGRRAPNGTVTASFATVPGSDQLAIVGSNLYVSDPGAGAIHRVALPGGAVTASFVSAVGGRGLTTDGTDLFLCTADGASAVTRITTGGATSSAAPAHPIASGATPACLAANGSLWDASALDGALESSTANGAWRLRAPSLAHDTAGGLWASEPPTFFIASGAARCAAGGNGAVAALSEDGTQLRVLASDACARNTLAADGTALYWADTRGTTVRKYDVASGALSVVVSDAGIPAASALAVSSVDGSLFVGVPGGAPRLAQYSSAGTLVAFSVSGVITTAPTGAAVAGGKLFVAVATKLVQFDLDQSGAALNPQTVAGPAQSLATFGSVAPSGQGVVFVAHGNAFELDAQGIRWLAPIPQASVVGRTPWGELLELHANAYPAARLP